MEYPRRVGPHPHPEEHVPELGDRGVGEDLLDVVLNQADGGREEGRQGAHPRNRHQCRRAHRVDAIAPRYEVDAGGDHRGRVDQGADRGRARHGIGEPHVERDLRALAGGPDEEQDPHGRHHPWRYRPGGGYLVHLRHVQSAEPEEHQHQAGGESHVAYPVGEEGLLAGVRAVVLRVVEADQQVGAEAYPLPPDEHDEVVPAEHQRQHHRHEEVQVGEVAPVSGVVGHVAHRVNVDQEPDEGDHEEHHAAQRVEDEEPADVELALKPKRRGEVPDR